MDHVADLERAHDGQLIRRASSIVRQLEMAEAISELRLETALLKKRSKEARDFELQRRALRAACESAKAELARNPVFEREATRVGERTVAILLASPRASGVDGHNHGLTSLALATEYASMRGWRIGCIHDPREARQKQGSESFDALRPEIEDGRIQGVLCITLDDLSNSLRGVLSACESLAKHRADLVCLRDSIDTSIGAWQPLLTGLRAASGIVDRQLAQASRPGVPSRTTFGGGAAPFGFRRQGKTLVLEDSEALVLRRVFELYLEHRRLKTVARILNREGRCTRNGGKFTDTSVRRCLENPVAIGQWYRNRTRASSHQKRRELKSREEWILTPVEAAVSAETWEAADRLLHRTKDSSTDPATR